MKFASYDFKYCFSAFVWVARNRENRGEITNQCVISFLCYSIDPLLLVHRLLSILELTTDPTSIVMFEFMCINE